VQSLSFGTHQRDKKIHKFSGKGHSQGCRGAATRWNAVPVNILEPERRSGKYRWPQVER